VRRSALVLAGGRATRMGGGEKARCALGGQTLAWRGVMEAIGAAVSTMCLNANGDAARFSDYGLPVTPTVSAGFRPPCWRARRNGLAQIRALRISDACGGHTLLPARSGRAPR